MEALRLQKASRFSGYRFICSHCHGKLIADKPVVSIKANSSPVPLIFHPYCLATRETLESLLEVVK